MSTPDSNSASLIEESSRSERNSMKRVEEVQMDTTFRAFLESEYIPEYADFTEALSYFKKDRTEEGVTIQCRFTFFFLSFFLFWSL